MPLLNLKKQNTGTGFTLDSNINWINFLKSGQAYEYVSADEALHNSDIFSLECFCQFAIFVAKI